MCDERERLLDYLYDESDAADRLKVDAHLEGCAECRREIAGLRRVRADLLAWDVPEHGSVWTPFAPVRPLPWFRQVPAWAMAAAAGVMFVVGGAGGVVTHAWFERSSPQAGPASAAVVGVTPVSAVARLSPADAAMLEQRILAEVHDEMAREPTRATPVSETTTLDAADVARQLKEFRATGASQLEILTALNNDFTAAQRRTNRQINALRTQVAALQSTTASSPASIR